MAHVVADRVRETWTGTGTGTVTPGGAVSGFRTFTSVLASSDTCPYVIEHQSAAEWETGIATWGGTALTRTTVIASSNANAAVSFSAGTKHIAISPLASLTPQFDPNGELYFFDDPDTGVTRPASNFLTLVTGGAEALRLDNSQRTLAGHTVSVTCRYAGAAAVPRTQMHHTTTSGNGLGLFRWSADAEPPLLHLVKAHSGTNGTAAGATVQTSDVLGGVCFSGFDGQATPVVQEGARIEVVALAAPSSNAVQARMRFLVGGGTTQQPPQRMVLDALGLGVGVATTNDASALLQVDSTTKGFLPPRMTTTQRNAITAVAGLTIFNTTTTKLEVYDGANWQACW